MRRIVLRRGGTDYESGDLVMADSCAYFEQIRETDPSTAAAWTQSGVDAVELGAKVQA